MFDTVLSFEYQRHSQMKVMVDGDQQDFGQKKIVSWFLFQHNINVKKKL